MSKSIGRIVTLLSRSIYNDLRDVVEPFGITVGEEPYFVELAHEDGLTQDELSNRVNVDKSATARAVKSLEAKGYMCGKQTCLISGIKGYTLLKVQKRYMYL